MTSPLASVTFKMASTRKVFVEETDENFEFLTDILFRFLTFDDAKIPIVSIVEKIRPSSHIAGHTFEGQCTSKFQGVRYTNGSPYQSLQSSLPALRTSLTPTNKPHKNPRLLERRYRQKSREAVKGQQ